MGNRNKKIIKEDAITLYELNKINMAQIEPLDKVWLFEQCAMAARYFLVENKNKYVSLLCREKYDFTVFNCCPKPYIVKDETRITTFAKEIYECLIERGDILDFTLQDTGAFEIWVRNPDTKENVAYYLFDYSQGVIEV